MDKKYSIKEVAEMFNISKNKIRFYEKKGILNPRRDKENNYRYFIQEDILKLYTILMYRMIDIPLDNIKDIMENYERNNIVEHLHKQWKFVNDEIHRLRLIHSCMEDIIDAFYSSTDIHEENFNEKILSFSKKTEAVYNLKNNWKDRWNFDDWAKNYDEAVLKDAGALKIYKSYEKILETVFINATKNIASDSIILEIGVGTGNLAKKFLQSGYEIIGIDQSRQMLNEAKTKLPNLKLRVGEFLKIPFENNSFNVIVSTYAFHHLDKDEKLMAIDEMLRVLKPSGRIVIGDLMFENEERKKDVYKNLTPEEIEEVEDEYYSDIEILTSAFNHYNRVLRFINIDLLNYIITVE